MADKTIGALTATAAVLLTDKVPKEPTAGPPAEYYTISQLKTLLDTIYAPVTGGAYVLKAGDTMTGLLTIAQATANTSALVSTGYSLTGANAQSLLSLAGTWNTSGSSSAIDLNITDTASAAGSSLLNLRVGGTPMFQIGKAGLINAVNSIVFAMAADNTPMFGGAGVVISGAASTVVAEFNSLWTTTGTPTSLGVDVLFDFGPSGAESFLFNTKYGGVSAFSIRKDGLVRVFNRINFLGSTSAFPSLKRSAALLQVRLADDSAYGDLEARIIRTTPAFTVGTLPAAGTAGRRTYVTDALGPAYGVAVAAGGAVVTPVFDNGAAWVVG